MYERAPLHILYSGYRVNKVRLRQRIHHSFVLFLLSIHWLSIFVAPLLFLSDEKFIYITIFRLRGA
jgi:hypothetical protein